MAINNDFSKIRPLLNTPIFSSKDARKLGINPSLLCYYAKKGLIKRLSHGLYQSTQTTLTVEKKYQPILKAIKGVNKGILCLEAALYIHKMLRKSPQTISIAISNDTTKPNRENIAFKRMRDTDTGLTSITLGGESFAIFDKERTILDCLRNKKVTTALQALKKGIEENSLDLDKLKSYAKKMRINISPYLLAFSI